MWSFSWSEPNLLSWIIIVKKDAVCMSKSQFQAHTSQRAPGTFQHDSQGSWKNINNINKQNVKKIPQHIVQCLEDCRSISDYKWHDQVFKVT